MHGSSFGFAARVCSWYMHKMSSSGRSGSRRGRVGAHSGSIRGRSSGRGSDPRDRLSDRSLESTSRAAPHEEEELRDFDIMAGLRQDDDQPAPPPPVEQSSPHASTSTSRALSSRARPQLPDVDPQSPLHPDTHWFYHSDVVHTTAESFKAFYEDAWFNFGEVPRDARDRMLGWFASQYTWDRSLDAQVRTAWEQKLQTRMRDDVFKARTQLLASEHGVDGVVPWISYDIGEKLLERWFSDPTIVHRSQVAAQNREKGRATHTQGSVSTILVEKRLEVSLKRKATQMELYVETHKKSDAPSVVETIQTGKSLADIPLVDEKATQFRDAFYERFSQMPESQVDESMDPEDAQQQLAAATSKAYLEVAGTTKGRVCGLGSAATHYYPKSVLSQASRTTSSQTVPEDYYRLQEEVVKLRDTVATQQQAYSSLQRTVVGQQEETSMLRQQMTLLFAKMGMDPSSTCQAQAGIPTSRFPPPPDDDAAPPEQQQLGLPGH